MGIDIEKELAESNERLSVALSDRELPLELQIRSIALTVAARYAADTAVKEGSLYQQLKLDNKLGDVITVEHAIRTALVFERYLWGEFSRGLISNALGATSREAADAIEAELEKRFQSEFGPEGEPPIKPHGG